MTTLLDLPVYWKTLLFHFIDIIVMNAWVIFCLYREGHPDAITRPTEYSHAAFTDALIRQLAGIPLNADVTIASKQLFYAAEAHRHEWMLERTRMGADMHRLEKAGADERCARLLEEKRGGKDSESP